MLFGRRLAVTLVKKTKDGTDDIPADSIPLQDIGDTIVDTAESIGSVIITVAASLTVLRITEHAIKHILR